jgi:plasmanylethanolamine desaturase
LDNSSTLSAAASSARPTADELTRYGRSQRVLELAGLCLFTSLLILHIGAIREATVSTLLICALAGWLGADLLSGIAHWAFDSFGSVRTPLFGAAFIRPFREHHADPRAMTRHDFVETNGSSCLACVPVLLFSLSTEMLFLTTLIAFLAPGILVTNQCHKWAHTENPGRLIGVLQSARLVLSPEEHRRHHTPPFNTRYCTASGWLNAPLDALLRALRG